METLRENGVRDLACFGRQCAECLANKISLVLDYSMSKRVIDAMKEDLLEQIKQEMSGNTLHVQATPSTRNELPSIRAI